MTTAISTIRTALAATILLTITAFWAASPSPARADVTDDCPPDEEYCVELPVDYQGECQYDYCYSDREICCILIE